MIFRLTHDSIIDLMKLKEIIQNVLPGSIFILKYEKNEVAFMNERQINSYWKTGLKNLEQKNKIELDKLNDENVIISYSEEKKPRITNSFRNLLLLFKILLQSP